MLTGEQMTGAVGGPEALSTGRREGLEAGPEAAGVG